MLSHSQCFVPRGAGVRRETRRESQLDKIPHFTTSFIVDQSPEAVVSAICSPKDWWSGEHEGEPKAVGDIFVYRYQDLHHSTQKVSELVPGERVVWTVLDCQLNYLDDVKDWAGTSIAFDVRRKGSKTEVTFTHVGLAPEVECYHTCSTSWTRLIQGSLKEFIETGRTELITLTASAG